MLQLSLKILLYFTCFLNQLHNDRTEVKPIYFDCSLQLFHYYYFFLGNHKTNQRRKRFSGLYNSLLFTLKDLILTYLVAAVSQRKKNSKTHYYLWCFKQFSLSCSFFKVSFLCPPKIAFFRIHISLIQSTSELL